MDDLYASISSSRLVCCFPFFMSLYNVARRGRGVLTSVRTLIIPRNSLTPLEESTFFLVFPDVRTIVRNL